MPPEKGQYRSIYSSLHEDPEWQSFDPMTQLVFFCLRTSRDCNFPCIYTFYRTTLYERMRTSEPSDIDAGMDALVAAGWIRYERPVLWIVKGLRNEPSFVPANSKQIHGIANTLRSLPRLDIIQEFADYYEIPMNSVGSKATPKEKPAPKEKPKELEDIIPAKDIIEYLNEKTGKNFSYTSRATKRHIAARWKEGFGLEEFRTVIDYQVAKWKGDPKMEEYLRPETLFGTKFESYLNAPPPADGVTRGTDTAGRALEELR
jgi:uncharacterized phage protein (TIGR02220 family)